MRLDRLTDDELDALEKGDLSRISDEGLAALDEGSGPMEAGKAVREKVIGSAADYAEKKSGGIDSPAEELGASVGKIIGRSLARTAAEAAIGPAIEPTIKAYGKVKEFEAKHIPFRQKLDEFVGLVRGVAQDEARKQPYDTLPGQVNRAGLALTEAGAQVAGMTPVAPSEIVEAEAAGVALRPVLGAVQRAMPAVNMRIATELNTLVYRAKKGLGIPQETGLVPYDIRAAVVSGRMSMAEAARRSEVIFQEELARRMATQAPKPPVAPADTAATVLKAEAQGVRGSVEKFPRLYSVLTGQAPAPAGTEARLSALASQVRQVLGLPEGAPVTPEAFHAAFSQGKVSFVDAGKADREIFDATSGLDPEGASLAYQDVQEAARRPEETLALAQAEEAALRPPEPVQEAPALAPDPLEVPHPETGKKPYEMEKGEFAEVVSKETQGEVSPAEAIDLHRSIVAQAEAQGRNVPGDAIVDVDPETVDTSFDVDEFDGPPSTSQKTIGEMSFEEFQKAFPGAPQEAHMAAVRRAGLQGRDVPKEVLHAYPEVRVDVEAALDEAMRRDLEKSGYSPTPVLDYVRSVGIDPESGLTKELRGELENLTKRGIFRKGGSGIDQIAQSAFNDGVIDDPSVNALLEKMDMEARLGTKAEQRKKTVKVLGGGSIAEGRAGYNRRFADAAQKKAIEDFGETEDFAEAGFMLDDGRLLDFSERRDGGPGGMRSADHRKVGSSMPKDPKWKEQENQPASRKMRQFMSYGNIRIKPEVWGVEMAVPPTRAQQKRIAEMASQRDGGIIVDVSDLDGNNIFSREYPRGTNPGEVLDDIRSAFEGGLGEIGGVREDGTYSLPGIEAGSRQDAMPPAPLGKPSSKASVPPKAVEFKGPGKGERQLAFNFNGTPQAEAKRIASEVEASIRKEFPNYKAMVEGAKQFEAQGKIDYVGKEVRGPADAAELFSLWRRPDMEHFQVMLVKDGKVVAHPTITSGIIDMAMVPLEFMKDVAAQAEALGADSFYLAHNHPSGVPDPSPEDYAITRRMVKGLNGAPKMKAEFRGHVVTDDTEFSLLNDKYLAQRHKFKTPKTDFRPDKAPVDEPHLAIDFISRELSDKSRIGVLLLDARRRVLGTEQIPALPGIADRVKDAIRHFKASAYIISADAKNVDLVYEERYPRGVLDLIIFDGDKVVSQAQTYSRHGFKTGKRVFDVKAGDEVMRVAEEEPRIPMRPDAFDAVVARRKLAPGSKVTVKTAFQDPLAGRIPRGRKGELVAISPDRKMLVNFEGDYAVVDPLDIVETFVPEPKGEKTLPVKKQVAQATGLDKDPELKALADKYRNQAIGARFGAREGDRRMKKFMLEILRAKLAVEKGKGKAELATADFLARQEAQAIVDIKKQVVEYITKSLPQSSRGKFLQMVRDAKTAKHAVRAFVRVDAEVSLLYKKGLIADIRKLVDRALDNARVAVEYKVKIREAIKDIELPGHREDTLKRLEATKAFIESKGGNVEMPSEVIDQLKILGRRPISELSEAELEGLFDSMRMLEDLGRTAFQVRARLYHLRKQKILSDLLAGTKAIDKHPQIKPALGEVLDVWGRFNNYIAKNLDRLQDLDLALMPMDVAFDMMDGGRGYSGPNWKTFRGLLNADFASYLDRKDEWVLPVREAINALKLNEGNLDRIGFHATRVQKGGPEYLEFNGYTADEIKTVKLSPAEEKVYNLMREIIEKPLDLVRKLLAELDNREIVKVANYFPYQTDWEAMTDVDVLLRMGDTVGGLGRYTKKVEQGSTITRKDGAKQRIKINALDIFEKHMDDVAYFISMQRNIQMLSEVAKSKEYGEVAGEVGQRIALQYLDLMAKKGGSEGAKRIARLDAWRRNYGAAVLGFKLSSILVQPTSLLDASAFLGGARVSKALTNVLTSPEWREFLMKFSELRKRVVDDPAFSELALDKRLEAFQRKGFAAMQALDALAAQSTVAAAYELHLARRGKNVDFSTVDPAAQEFALLMLRRTQSSGYFKDLSFAFTRGGITGNTSIDKAWGQFKSFAWNRWSLIRYDLPELWKMDKPAAVQAFIYLSLSNVAQAGVKWGSRSLIAGALAGAGLVVDEAFEEDDFSENVAKEFLEMPPFVSDAIQMAVYRRAPVPSLEPIYSGGFAGYRTIQAVKQRDGRKALKAIGNAVTALAERAGIPGTVQVAQIMGMVMDDGSIKFPFAEEWRGLDKLVKENKDTAEERSRWTELKAAHKRFLALNKKYKAAMDEGDTPAAAALAQEMAEEMRAYK